MKEYKSIRLASIISALFLISLIGIGHAEFGYLTTFSTDTQMASYATALAVDANGGLYYATFNPSGTPGPCYVVYIPDWKNNPYSFITVASADFLAARGFQGLTLDSAGNVYASGDSGSGGIVRKRGPAPTFTPPTGFGTNGDLNYSTRIGGCVVVGDYLALIPFNGIHFINLTDASLATTVSGGQIYQREAAFNPNNNAIYVSRNGAFLPWAVTLWEGGSPASPATLSQYTAVTAYIQTGAIATQYGVSGQGIWYDPVLDRLFVPHRNDGTTVQEYIAIYDPANPTAPVETITPARPNPTDLCDVVTYHDGNIVYLFITDITERAIHVYQQPPPLELTLIGSPILSPGDTRTLIVSGGQAPYTWSITTVSGNPGYLSTYTGATVTFIATGVGSCYITVTDNVGQTKDSPIITVTPTEAPLQPDVESVISIRKEIIN